jgi:hypothetical protein
MVTVEQLREAIRKLGFSETDVLRLARIKPVPR